MVIPTMWHNRPGLRLEVHGCAISTVRGQQQKKTFLRKTDAPHVISDDIIVPAGVTLTIESGVQLNFNKDAGIFVEGMFFVMCSVRQRCSLCFLASVYSVV